MKIADTYTVERQGVKLTYKLRDQLSDLERVDEIKSIIDDKDLKYSDKQRKILKLALEDLVDISGIEHADGTAVSIDDILNLKIPSVYIDWLIETYKNHKTELATGLSADKIEKNA